MAELRRTLARFGATMQVVKNTLLARSLSEEQRGLAQYLKGPVAATFCSGDYGALLKEMTNFARTHPQLEFRSWVDACRPAGHDHLTLPPQQLLRCW
jgi:ribosomal protein L10